MIKMSIGSWNFGLKEFALWKGKDSYTMGVLSRDLMQKKRNMIALAFHNCFDAELF